MHPRRHLAGFSLIEVLVTVAIVGILSAIAVPSWTTMVAKARQAEAKGSLNAIHGLEFAHFADRNTFTTLANVGFVREGSGHYAFLIDMNEGPTTGGGSADFGGGDEMEEGGADDDDDAATPPIPFPGWNQPNPIPIPGMQQPMGPSVPGNPHADGASYEVVAAGNISPAIDFDVWIGNSEGEMYNLTVGY